MTNRFFVGENLFGEQVADEYYLCFLAHFLLSEISTPQERNPHCSEILSIDAPEIIIETIFGTGRWATLYRVRHVIGLSAERKLTDQANAFHPREATDA